MRKSRVILSNQKPESCSSQKKWFLSAWVVKLATSLFKWFYGNVAKQDARFDVRLTVPVVIKLCYFFRIRKMTPSMISLLIAITCLPWVKGQFPKVCVNLESLKNKTCCPKPNGYHEPCGSDGNRGVPRNKSSPVGRYLHSLPRVPQEGRAPQLAQCTLQQNLQVQVKLCRIRL